MESIDYKISSLNVGKAEKLFLYVLKERGATEEPFDVSITDLCHLASGSRNTIVKVIRNLEEAKYIQVREGSGRSNHTYRILPDNFKKRS